MLLIIYYFDNTVIFISFSIFILNFNIKLSIIKFHAKLNLKVINIVIKYSSFTNKLYVRTYLYRILFSFFSSADIDVTILCFM